jgi:ubiquinone/menaquinone biosynthesis C-methylase UbiE
MRSQEAEALHNRVVVDQFGKQAAVFAQLPGHEDATRLLIEMADVGPDDEILDVACGPGLVASAAAPHVRRVVGIDLTPAMIDQARTLQSRLGLANMEWHVGNAAALPWEANRFTATLTRYSLHHFSDPMQVLSEMVRVTRPGGRVVVADLVLPDEQGRAYDRMERLRDPSHLRVLSNIELGKVMTSVGLREVRWAGYLFRLDLSTLLRGSFQPPADLARVQERFEQDIGNNRLGIGVHRHLGAIWFSYPIAVAVGLKDDT